MTDGNLAVIDVVFLAMVEFTRVRACIFDFIIAAQLDGTQPTIRKPLIGGLRYFLDPPDELPAAGDAGIDLWSALGPRQPQPVCHLAGPCSRLGNFRVKQHRLTKPWRQG
jgi:hypothetical protein